MRLHKVIATFKHGGQLVNPPCLWLPLSEEMAAKMVRAGCIRLATNSEIRAHEGIFSGPSGADPINPVAAPAPSTKKRRGRRRGK